MYNSEYIYIPEKFFLVSGLLTSKIWPPLHGIPKFNGARVENCASYKMGRRRCKGKVFGFMVLFRLVLNLITSQHLTVNSSAWKKYSPAHDEVV